MKGKLLIFSAPSGAGKTTIVHHLLKQDFDLFFSVSACSRVKRHNEEDGVDYQFVGEEKFKELILKGSFLEWEEVYPKQFYGTLKSSVDSLIDQGKNVIFDVDVVGGLNIKSQYGNRALSVFVQPPSMEKLKQRLLGRSTESTENQNRRLQKATKEMDAAQQFDRILINDNLETAFAEAEEIAKEFLLN